MYIIQVFFRGTQYEGTNVKPRTRTYHNVTGWNSDRGIMIITTTPDPTTTEPETVMLVLDAVERVEVRTPPPK